MIRVNDYGKQPVGLWYSSTKYKRRIIRLNNVSSKLPSILINGQKTDQVSVLNRGFQYGDGLFETIHVIAGKPQYWQQHMERLSDGCIRLPARQMPIFYIHTLAHSLGIAMVRSRKPVSSIS